MTRLRAFLLLLLSASVVLGSPEVAHATVYAQIEGTGSTWSQLIVEQWISDVNANGMQVVYTGGGSSKGRRDFANDSTDFAISEIPYQGTDEQGNADTSNGRGYAYLPIVAGGTAFTYQLKVGGTMVRNLRLSGETLSKIFTNQITNWDDPAITKDNNGRKFPDLAITPVVRSDGSGTTAQLTTWMDKQYPSIWRPYYGHSGLTSYYPIKPGSRMVGQAGSDQVMNTVSSFAGNGDIGYVEYSYPVNKNYPVVKVLNKAGYYVEPTQYNTAVALTKAKINHDKSSNLYLTQILDGVYTNPDPRAYPISSYSYMIIPTDGGRPADDDGQAADPGRLPLLLAVLGADQGRAVRLLAAAAQPGAGGLPADREAQAGRSQGQPDQPQRHDVSQPDVRRRPPVREPPGPDRSPARRL